MANRFPLIIDTADGNKIKELPNGDSLNLTGNAIVGVGNISSTGALSVASISVQGSVVASSNVIASANMQAADFLIGGVSVLDSINYADLLNKPTLATVATTGNYNDLNNRLTFSAVATTGNYNDLNNRPSIPTDVADLTDNTGLIGGGAFTDLSDTPDSYVGEAGKYLVVNPGATGLAFSTVTTSITSQQIISALGYTPYNGTANSNGYINDNVGIVDALGYTPYNGATNPNGYITGITDTLVINALGFTPYANNNPDGFIKDSAGVVSALGFTPYNGATNPNNYITAEADTLSTVTGRGATTNVTITAAGFTTTGNIAASSISLSTGISFTSTGTITLDGGTGSTLVVGGTSNVSLRDVSGSIDVQASIVPNVSGSRDLGSSGSVFNNVYTNIVNTSDIAFTASPGLVTMTGNLEITPGSATGVVRVTRGGFGIPATTTTNRNSLSGVQAGYMIFNSTLNTYQGYTSQGGPGASAGWINLWTGPPGAQPASPYTGQLAIADGTLWNPNGDNTEALMCYLNAGWVVVA